MGRGRVCWKCPSGAGVGAGQGQDWSQDLVGQQLREAGEDRPGTGSGTVPQEGAPGATIPVHKLLWKVGLRGPTLLSVVLENGVEHRAVPEEQMSGLVPGRAGLSSAPGQASSCSQPSSGGAGRLGRE